MPVDLDALVDPAHAVVVTQECQRGVLGEDATFPALAEAARDRHMLEAISSLLAAARRAEVPVVHCVVERRPDNRGSNRNARIFVAAERSPRRLVRGAESAQLMAGLGPDPTDFVVSRLHGVSPMHDTGLDSLLRNLGCKTIVATGVSLNVAMVGFAFEAVNRGYQVVMPQDAVAGVPSEYAEAVLENTIAMVATVPDSSAVIASWERRAPMGSG